MNTILSSSVALITLMSSLVLAGCGAAADETPAGQSADDVTAKSTGVFLALSNEKAGGDISEITTVKLANSTKTRCATGESAKDCTVVGLDFSALDLSSAKEAALDKAFRAGHALVQGKIQFPDAQKLSGIGNGVFPEIVVTAAWTSAGGTNVADAEFDTLFLVHDIAEFQCLNGCNHASETTVNGTKAVKPLVGVNFDSMSASKKELSEATDAMKIGAAGLYVLGINESLIHAGVGTGVTSFTNLIATDFFLPVK